MPGTVMQACNLSVGQAETGIFLELPGQLVSLP